MHLSAPLVIFVIILVVVFGSDAYARCAALRAVPREGRRFTCVDVNRERGARVLVVGDEGYTVYRRGNREAQISYGDVRTVSVIRSSGLVWKRRLMGLAVQAQDGRAAFYVINGYVGLVGHSHRARQAAASMSVHLPASRAAT